MPASPVLLLGLPPDEPAVGLTVALRGDRAVRPIWRGRERRILGSPRLLWSSWSSERGVALSNPVPVDDPEALAAMLRGRDDADRGALRELDWDELDAP